MSKKIAIINGREYYTPFAKLAKELGLEFSFEWQELCERPENFSLAVFTGGEDVSPQLYGDPKHRSTHSNLQRDAEEFLCAQVAIARDIPLVGICRGAQILCVLAGGKLVQDVTGHHSTHEILVKLPGVPERRVLVSSSHHQMQAPTMPSSQFEILGWSEKPLSEHYVIGTEKFLLEEFYPAQHEHTRMVTMEPDIVWYKEIKALAAQYHPEWMADSSEGFKLFEELLDIYIKPLIVEQQ